MDTRKRKTKKQASIRLERSLYDKVFAICEKEERTPSNLMNVFIKKTFVDIESFDWKQFETQKKPSIGQSYSLPFRVDADIHERVSSIAETYDMSVSYVFYILLKKQIELYDL